MMRLSRAGRAVEDDALAVEDRAPDAAAAVGGDRPRRRASACARIASPARQATWLADSARALAPGAGTWRPG